MSEGLKALEHLGRDFELAFNEYKKLKDDKDIIKSWDLFFPYFEKDLCIIKKELKTLEILKEICLEGKDKYGKGTWGWVEFDLDKEPKLKEWLKDD